MLTKEQAMELFELCLDVKGMGARQQKITGDLPTVWFDFCGCAGKVMALIRVSTKGEASQGDDIVQVYPEHSFDEVKEYLTELKKKTAELALKGGHTNSID